MSLFKSANSEFPFSKFVLPLEKIDKSVSNNLFSRMLSQNELSEKIRKIESTYRIAIQRIVKESIVFGTRMKK